MLLKLRCSVGPRSEVAADDPILARTPRLIRMFLCGLCVSWRLGENLLLPFRGNGASRTFIHPSVRLAHMGTAWQAAPRYRCTLPEPPPRTNWSTSSLVKRLKSPGIECFSAD